MKNLFKSKKFYIKLLILLAILYAISVFYNQQIKMNSYSKEIEYYNSHIEDLNKKHEELVETKENVNSPEYIEEAARERLEMYLPNERVYIDIGK